VPACSLQKLTPPRTKKKIHDHAIVDFLLVPAAGLEPAT
jgi:hypothetical protein